MTITYIELVKMTWPSWRNDLFYGNNKLSWTKRAFIDINKWFIDINKWFINIDKSFINK